MPDSMRALARHAPSGPFSEVELPVPTPGPRDLVVEVRAVSVNPVGTEVHAAGDPGGEPKVLGHDAAGVVSAVGSDGRAHAQVADGHMMGKIVMGGFAS
jgi:NADPH:quinone reductase-like Zn-dependent oxidoreductase